MGAPYARAVSYEVPPETLARLGEAQVEEALRALYVTREGSSLRPEEVKKIPQLAGLLHRDLQLPEGGLRLGLREQGHELLPVHVAAPVQVGLLEEDP